jgi:hypothetical protein
VSLRRRPRAGWNPAAPERPALVDPVYAEGSYLVSESGEAATWAVFRLGHWGLVYECNDVQILSAWVRERDIPLHVLAEAMAKDSA